MFPNMTFEDNCYAFCIVSFDITVCSEDDYVDCFMYPKRILEREYLVPVTVLLSCIFLTGLVGNICVCAVIARHPILRSETNAYLFSLAISDLFMLVFGLPQELWTYWQMYPYIFGGFLCRFLPFMAAIGSYSSMLTIAAFAIERYEAICHPLHTRSRGVKRVVIALSAAWTISAAAALLILHVYKVERVMSYPPLEISSYLGIPQKSLEQSTACYVPSETKYYYKYFYVGNTVVFFCIPMFILLLAYTKIALYIRKNRQLSRNCGILNSCSENRKIIRMLVAAVIAFFVCGAPYHYQRVFDKPIGESTQEMHRIRRVKVVIAICFYFSATLNPILYNVVSKRYQKAFMDIFGRRMTLKKPQQHQLLNFLEKIPRRYC